MAISWEIARNELRIWREENRRCSEQVIQLYEDILAPFVPGLGEEEWLIYEQVCIASFDCSRLDIAEECLEALEKRFPESLRVRKLQAMKAEVMEEYEEALSLYNSIISQDDSNAIARKRKISLLKTVGSNADAIKELNQYLKLFMSDQEAWGELCDLYIKENEMNKAAFCMEELILYEPHNHLLHQKYADIRYTQGGFENLELAKGYYAQAVRLNSNSMRALYGLFLTSSQLATYVKCPAIKKKEYVKEALWASQKITQSYKDVENRSGDKTELKIVESMLSSMQIQSPEK